MCLTRIDMDLSSNIKAIRNSKHIAQAEIARRLEIDASSYHRLENRGNKLTLEQIDGIAQALEVSRLELLTWGEESTPDGNADDVNRLRQRNTELESQLADKTQLQQYHNKQLQRMNLWFANYFRHEVWQVAHKLDMVDASVSYMSVIDYYGAWDMEEKSRIVEGGLADNPFIYQMVNRDLYIDNQEFADLILERGTPENVADYQRRNNAGK